MAALKTFNVWDATKLDGKPALGIPGLWITYNNDTFPPEIQDWNHDWVQPDQARVVACADAATVAGCVAITFDIETVWPLDARQATLAQVMESIGKFTRIVNWTRARQPRLQVSICGSEALRPGSLNGSDELITDLSNRALTELFKRLDFLCPLCYVEESDGAERITKWKSLTGARLIASRRFEKPIKPLLWINSHSYTVAEGGTKLSQAEFAECLNFLDENAEGVGIWEGWRRPWRAPEPWWLATQAFLSKQ